MRGFEQRRVKFFARDIVSVTRQPTQLLEEEGEICIVAQIEGRPGFQSAELPHRVLNAQFAKHRDDGGHERFADNERSGLGFVPDGNTDTGASQQYSESAGNRATAEDGDRVDAAV